MDILKATSEKYGDGVPRDAGACYLERAGFVVKEDGSFTLTTLCRLWVPLRVLKTGTLILNDSLTGDSKRFVIRAIKPKRRKRIKKGGKCGGKHPSLDEAFGCEKCNNPIRRLKC